MDFGTILKRAWEIIWNHKILWLFGIFAALGSNGGGGSSNFGFSASGTGAGSDFGGLPPNMQRFFFNLERSIERVRPEQIFAIAAVIIVFAFVLAIGLFLLRVLGRVALIKGAQQAELGHKLSFGQLVNDSKPYYLRAVGLAVLLGITVAIIAFAGFAFIAVFGTITFGIGLLCLIPLICLLIPIAFGYGVYVEMVNNALVIEDLGIGDALQRGWEILRANLGNLAMMAIILLIGGGILTFLITLPFFIVLLPIFATIIAGNGEAVLGGFAASGMLLLIVLPIFVLLSGILRSYISSAWTLSFLDLSSAPARAIPAAPKAPAKPKASPRKVAAKSKSASPKPKTKS